MLRSKEEIDAWAQEHGGEQGVRIAADQKKFGYAPEAYAHINEWLREKDESRRVAISEGDQSLRLREVEASEKSADAAWRSARSARHSAILASIATAIAFVALVAQYVKKN